MSEGIFKLCGCAQVATTLANFKSAVSRGPTRATRPGQPLTSNCFTGSSKNKPKKVAGRPKGSKNKRKSRPALSGLDGLVGMLKNLERERDDALKTLAKIRDLMS